MVNCNVSDFENKLAAMGFDLTATPDAGKVATLDLTPHRQKARQRSKTEPDRDIDELMGSNRAKAAQNSQVTY